MRVGDRRKSGYRAGDRARAGDLADEVDVADVDAQFERGRGDQRLEFAALELLFGVQALLADMLAHHYAADSLEQAFASRGSLPPGAQFIVREGHQVGRLTAMLHAADSEAEGMLARLHEIENLTREQRAQHGAIAARIDRRLDRGLGRHSVAEPEQYADQPDARFERLRIVGNRPLQFGAALLQVGAQNRERQARCVVYQRPDRLRLTEAELEDALSEPTPGVAETLQRHPGDIVLLGAAGKMGPSLARMAKRADPSRRVLAASRFSSGGAEAFAAHGIEVVRCDLLNEVEVAKRWWRICPGIRGKDQRAAEPDLRDLRIWIDDPDVIGELRYRLTSISWMMQLFNARVARRANAESGRKGHFFEGRFRSKRLLDEASIIACSLYVDMNPIRAEMATLMGDWGASSNQIGKTYPYLQNLEPGAARMIKDRKSVV